MSGDFAITFENGSFLFKITVDVDKSKPEGGETNGHQDCGGGGGASWYSYGGYSYVRTSGGSLVSSTLQLV